MSDTVTTQADERPSVNQNVLLDETARELDMKRGDVQAVYESLVNKTLARLWAGEEVTYTQLLKFELVDRPEHEGRNPMTGEPAHVPARRVVKVRNRSDLNKIAAVLDDDGSVQRETDEHPTVVRRRERDQRRAEEAERRARVAEADRQARRAQHELANMQIVARNAELRLREARGDDTESELTEA